MEFVLFVFLGSLTGLLVGALPGLSVTMATALLVSVTYTWDVHQALAMIMGLYVVGVFSGAVSAILINIPGAPSSVATTLDGFPMAKKGEAYHALFIAVIYSFVGSVVGFAALWIFAKPITAIALKFSPIDYFLLSLFGLTTVGSLTSKNYTKGLISAVLGVLLSLVGIDPIMGSVRLTFGITELQAGIQLVPVLIGLFGFAEVLHMILEKDRFAIVAKMDKRPMAWKQIFRHMPLALRSSIIGVFIGALPGAGSPVASLLAYEQAKKTVKTNQVPFGEGAEEGIVASETANNACIGGALIPMLTLAIPGDAVTAILLSVFYVHGLRPGPLMMHQNPELLHSVLAGGFIGCVALLLLGLLLAPHLARLVQVPKEILLPIVMILCMIGAYAVRSNTFDICLMVVFGLLGLLMRFFEFPTAPMVLGLVLGGMMDSNFRRAVSLASASDHWLRAMFGSPITLLLVIVTLGTLLTNIVSKSKNKSNN